MAVINLGTFGDRRESELSGLSTALAQGLQVGTGMREARVREETLKATLAQNAIENKRAQQEIDLKKAQQTFDKEIKGKEFAKKMVEDLSLKMAGMDNPTKADFKASPGYKQMAKVIKRYASEFIGEDGEILEMPIKELILNKADAIAGMVSEKKVAGQALTPGEAAFYDDYQKDKTALARIYEAVQYDDRFMDAQERGDDEAMARIVDTYRAKIFAKRSPTSEQLATDPRDTLRLLQR